MLGEIKNFFVIYIVGDLFILRNLLNVTNTEVRFIIILIISHFGYNLFFKSLINFIIIHFLTEAKDQFVV